MTEKEEAKPDFVKGIALSAVPDSGILGGTVGGVSVLLIRDGEDIRAFDGTCPHLGAPLYKGLVVDDTVRCPWHHACFSLRSGEAVRPPAFDALRRWVVERHGDQVFVSRPAESPALAPRRFEGHSQPGLVIIGGGAAGYAAAHEARRCGHEGPVTIVSDELDEPYDRTLLTKDYLEGNFGADRLPIAQSTLADLDVTFLAGTTCEAVDAAARHVHLSGDHTLPYVKLLLAVGAEPKRLDVPGADLPHVHVLRSLHHCRTLLAQLKPGLRVVVIGSSFIGLEAAASIRARGYAVSVVTPEAEPMARIVGTELARTILGVHTAKGIVFYTEAHIAAISETAVRLKDGSSLAADLVVVGIGVTPRTALAEKAGLRLDDGVVVDGCLRTSAPNVYAAGDIARWPDPHSGAMLRVEHWVLAQRQGQVAARNMLGGAERFDAVPFFWSKHFDFSFRYMGHAESWDDLAIEGDLDSRKVVMRYRKGGQQIAVVTVESDLDSLRIEREMEAERSPDALRL